MTIWNPAEPARGPSSTAISGEIEMNSLKGKGAVVTGAASGIGKAIATAFVEAGASVLLCDLNAKALDAAAHELGARAIGRVTDVSDESAVEGAMRAAREAFGSLDIVVNCAGFGAIVPLTELSGEKWKAVQAVTLGGVFYGVKHAARQMLDQGRPGVIINISSVNAQQPGEGQVAYCAAKAGVDMITRCGALELGGRGIRVVGIAPGLVETPLTKHELENPAMRELFLSVIPMRRAVAAQEIAAAAVFLASDEARSINGNTIAVDGGSLTRGYPALLTGLKKAS
jgi:NAD(P)-dependent dehydrogenase (short-subunit alcohol dehydrogenase family)